MQRKLGFPTFCPPNALTKHHRRHASSYGRARTRCCASSPVPGSTVISWNVNSLRALLRKNPHALHQLVDRYDPDVICLQETKLQEQHQELFYDLLPGYGATFNSSQSRKGYSGTATFSKTAPFTVQRSINHGIGDEEGRLVESVFPGVAIINVYTMNSGTNLKRLPTRLQWDSAFRKHINVTRREGRPVLVVGDLNVARDGVDVYDERAVQGLAGFSKEERTSFEDLLEVCGLVDAFRMLYPERREYTYWDYRTRARQANRGWRIDYALVTEDMTAAVRDVRVLGEVEGSDHCPVAVDLAPGMLCDENVAAKPFGVRDTS